MTLTSRPWLAPLCVGTQLCGAAEVAEIAPGLAAAGYEAVELHPLQLAAMGDLAHRRQSRRGDPLGWAQSGVRVRGRRLGRTVCRPGQPGDARWRPPFGAEVVFIVPASRKSGSFDELAAQVREVCRRAGEFGLKVAVHNHAGTLRDDGAGAARLHRGGGQARSRPLPRYRSSGTVRGRRPGGDRRARPARRAICT